MKIAAHTQWLLAVGILSIGITMVRADESKDPGPAADSASPAASEKTEQPDSKTDKKEASKTGAAVEAQGIDLFQAIDDGLVDVKFVARSDSKGRLIVTNKTDQPVAFQIPDAFAGVPVAKQFGGGGGGGLGGGGGGGGGNQSVGGGGGGGLGGGGGGFNIAPEKVERIDIPLVCLDHGLKDPSSSKPYEIRPIEDVVSSQAVVEIVKAFANGELPRGATQAAVWHLNSEVTWIDLANKLTGTDRQFVRGPYFSGEEIRIAMAIVHQAQAMTEGVKLERRNWKSPTDEETSEETVVEESEVEESEVEETTPEVVDPEIKADSDAEEASTPAEEAAEQQ